MASTSSFQFGQPLPDELAETNEEKMALFPRSSPFKSSANQVFLDHSALEIHLPWLRELCLDQSSSPLWDLVDKSVFERLTSEATPVPIRHQEQLKLYGIATVFLYEQLKCKTNLNSSRV
jgi:hypothetical protein